MYKYTEYYHLEDEHTIIWNDPDLSIDWPLLRNLLPLLSTEDSNGVKLKEAKIFS